VEVHFNCNDKNSVNWWEQGGFQGTPSLASTMVSRWDEECESKYRSSRFQFLKGPERSPKPWNASKKRLPMGCTMYVICLTKNSLCFKYGQNYNPYPSIVVFGSAPKAH